MGGIDRLSARSIRSVLEELGGLKAAGKEPPEVEFCLASGHTVAGRLLSYQPEGRDAGSIVLHASGSRFGMDAVYLRADSVVALTVRHTEQSLPMVSGGRVAPKPAEVAGRLVLERRARALGEALSAARGGPLLVTVDWEAFGASEGALAALTLTLPAIGAVLEAILSDALGKEALAGVAEVLVVPAKSAEIKREGARVLVRLERDGDEVFALPEKSLREQLEAIL
ncbi:MAG: hypothetical protein U1E65_30470 [Myxococcota bacterium]